MCRKTLQSSFLGGCIELVQFSMTGNIPPAVKGEPKVPLLL